MVGRGRGVAGGGGDGGGVFCAKANRSDSFRILAGNVLDLG